MREPERARKRGARVRRDQRGRQVATAHYWLRCPRCRAFKDVSVPEYEDPHSFYEEMPYLVCDGCGEMSATTAWHVALYQRVPLGV